jgi:hypothetical protein
MSACLPLQRNLGYKKIKTYLVYQSRAIQPQPEFLSRVEHFIKLTPRTSCPVEIKRELEAQFTLMHNGIRGAQIAFEVIRKLVPKDKQRTPFVEFEVTILCVFYAPAAHLLQCRWCTQSTCELIQTIKGVRASRPRRETAFITRLETEV